ncbi:MAG: CoA transferase, partial [Novosphingobium sp.]
MDETDELITAWTQLHDSAEAFELAKRARVPCAPVRKLMDVWHDPHMLERGMLEWVDHPRLGRVVLPNSPLRIHGADKVDQVPAPELGEHTASILTQMLGMSEAEIAELRRTQAI